MPASRHHIVHMHFSGMYLLCFYAGLFPREGSARFLFDFRFFSKGLDKVAICYYYKIR